jgi:Major intrinsic protein
MTLARRAAAEAVGTAFLLIAVVGSGIMGERLAGGNVAIALLANSMATGGALVALILTLGPLSGAHFNPAVTLTDATQGGLGWRDVPAYCTSVRRIRWGCDRSSHVWRAVVYRIHPRSLWTGTGIRRIHRNLWPVMRDPRVFAIALGCCGAGCCGCLHHRGVLVHGFDFVCQSGCDVGACSDRYVLWNSTE